VCVCQGGGICDCVRADLHHLHGYPTVSHFWLYSSVVLPVRGVGWGGGDSGLPRVWRSLPVLVPTAGGSCSVHVLLSSCISGVPSISGADIAQEWVGSLVRTAGKLFCTDEM